MKKILVVVLVLGLAIPAMAAEFELGGRARVVWSYTSNDSDVDQRGDDTVMLFREPAAASSIITLKAKASDTLSGYAELGYTNAGASETTKFKQLYGTWNFGGGKFTVGRAFSPAYAVVLHSVLNDEDPMFHHGSFRTERNNLLKLGFNGFEIALLDNKGADLTNDGGYDTDDSMFPKIEAAYVFTSGPVWLKPFAGVQISSAKNTATDNSKSVTAYAAGSYFKINLGSAWVGGDVFYSQNPGNYSVYLFSPPPPANWPDYSTATIEGNSVKDATVFAGCVGGGVKLTNLVGLEAGIGYQKLEQDVDAKIEDDQLTWYFQAPLSLAKGVMIVPEVGQIIRGDFKEDGTVTNKQGTSSYLAAMFQITF